MISILPRMHGNAQFGARRTNLNFPLERRDLDMQDGSDSAIDSSEAPIDRSGEFIRLADEFAMRAEGAANIGEASLLALPARAQGLGREVSVDSEPGG
jgi:hypothetical protein